MKYHTKQWFLRRLGKDIHRAPIFRQDGERCCDMCSNTTIHIADKQVANYLWICQYDLQIEYSDKPIC